MTNRKYIPEKFATGGMIKLPRAMPLEWIEVHMISLLRKAGVDPAVIHAFETTALWITKINEVTFTKKELSTWDSAVASFDEKRVR